MSDMVLHVWREERSPGGSLMVVCSSQLEPELAIPPELPTREAEAMASDYGWRLCKRCAKALIS